MKKWLKENWFKIGLIVVGLGAVFALYQALVSIPREKMERQAAEQRTERFAEDTQRTLMRTSLNMCLDSAEISKSSWWESECIRLRGTEECALPEFNVDMITKAYENDKDDCFKKYPIN